MSGASAVGGNIYNTPPFDPSQPQADLPPWVLAAAIVGVVLVALIAVKK